MSFLALEGLHAFVTGAASGVGAAAVKEFLANGCKVTLFDRNKIQTNQYNSTADRIFTVVGDLQDEASIQAAFQDAVHHFGPVNILAANAGIFTPNVPIWDIATSDWDHVHKTNVRGTFLTIKRFLLSVKEHQEATGTQLQNMSIVLTGSETGVFGLENNAEYATGKAGLQYGLVRTVKNEIVRLNPSARINAVAPGLINTPLIAGLADDPKVYWRDTQATVALKKIAQPEDVARAIVFLSSHRAAGHMTGQCLSVDGGQEGRLLWTEEEILKSATTTSATSSTTAPIAIIPELAPPTRRRRLRICLTIDFDAISGYLGTGHHPNNTISDLSAGLFSATVGVTRLLKLFSRYNIANNTTWFIPGHSMETFPEQTAAIIASGVEIGLHGYSHEGADAMTEQQEVDVIDKCIELCTTVTGKRPVGYRGPLYRIRDHTIKVLRERDFLYDSSMNAHDSLPYYLTLPHPVGQMTVPDYTLPASSWMKPALIPPQPTPNSSEAQSAIVEIPGSWYTEDMTPLGFYPYEPSTQGYVSVSVVERMWWDRFEWIWNEESWVDGDEGNGWGSVFPIIWHPESAGRSHVVGMIEQFIKALKERQKGAGTGEITFETMESVARSWRERP